MKHLTLFYLLFYCLNINAQDTVAVDTVFWSYAYGFEVGEKGTINHDWGSETVTYLGTVQWRSPSKKLLTIRLVTSYRRITQANGFNDQSIVALVKSDNSLIKTYDFVKRQNLPVEIRDNNLVFVKNGQEVESAMPLRFGERFCVEGLICYDEILLTF